MTTQTLHHLRALEAAALRLAAEIDNRRTLADAVKAARLRHAQRMARALRGMGARS